jgi:hypothetical protein
LIFLVSCVPYVASFSAFSCLLHLRYSCTFICPVSCVPYVVNFPALSSSYNTIRSYLKKISG